MFLLRYCWTRGSSLGYNHQENAIIESSATVVESLLISNEEYPDEKVSADEVCTNNMEVEGDVQVSSTVVDASEEPNTPIEEVSIKVNQPTIAALCSGGDDDLRDIDNEDGIAHPDNIFVPKKQYDAENNIAQYIEKVHTDPKGGYVALKCSGTTFNVQSFHYKSLNTSVPLHNDPSTTSKRLEYVDFTRRRDDRLLYLWDSRQAIVISLLNDENKYKTRVFIAMTNLFMPLDDKGNRLESFVLLDLLVRMDAYAHIDAVVGVRSTGEVILWKHSLDHLRFCFCDLQSPISGGEVYWKEQLAEFYTSKGLYYLPQRMIPRDLDAPRTRFAFNKEYITHYINTYNCPNKLQENFDKWYIMPGRFKSQEEESRDLLEALGRNKKVTSKMAADAQVEKNKMKIQDEKNKLAAAKRKATNEQNKKRKAAEAAAAAKEKAAQEILKRGAAEEVTVLHKAAEKVAHHTKGSIAAEKGSPVTKVVVGRDKGDQQPPTVGYSTSVSCFSSSSSSCHSVVDAMLRDLLMQDESMHYQHASEMQGNK